jgi:hypothetical protein
MADESISDSDTLVGNVAAQGDLLDRIATEVRANTDEWNRIQQRTSQNVVQPLFTLIESLKQRVQDLEADRGIDNGDVTNIDRLVRDVRGRLGLSADPMVTAPECIVLQIIGRSMIARKNLDIRQFKRVSCCNQNSRYIYKT